MALAEDERTNEGGCQVALFVLVQIHVVVSNVDVRHRFRHE